LTDAFTAGSKAGVFLFGFSGCHINVLSMSEDVVKRTSDSSRCSTRPLQRLWPLHEDRSSTKREPRLCQPNRFALDWARMTAFVPARGRYTP
jgi:hypothetical protein